MDSSGIALALSGGGARGAYQVGFLRHLCRRYPDFPVEILTGASAGAVNAIQLANHTGRFCERVEDLTRAWQSLSVDQVFRVDALSLLPRGFRWIAQLSLLGGRRNVPQAKGLVDTAPLREFLYRALETSDGTLPGIQHNLAEGTLRAVALSTTHYKSGSTVVFCQGEEVEEWERPQRHSVMREMTVEHVMASAALPLFFPAVELNGQWFGDGGLRLHSPLAPAVHLGARKIIAVSTRADEMRRPVQVPLPPSAYPPPAQIVGVLFNSVFLDLLDQDALRLERINRLIRAGASQEKTGLRPVDLLILRPSVELSKIAQDYEPELPKLFRFITRRFGARDNQSSDVLSMLMFQGNFLTRIIELGEADADARADEIARFIESSEGDL
ncbi:MAG: patatin-like phospholipase family protein [Myxococcota bacterium]